MEKTHAALQVAHKHFNLGLISGRRSVLGQDSRRTRLEGLSEKHRGLQGQAQALQGELQDRLDDVDRRSRALKGERAPWGPPSA
jgi:hypothetical protein